MGAGGQPQVEKMLGILRSELAVAMILTGCVNVADAGPSLLDGRPG
jgi:L-lactate dehydrogenase (cytochrome)